MRLSEWTVTIRPFKVLWRLCLVLIVPALVIVSPSVTANPQKPLDPAVQARFAAITAVTNHLSAKMRLEHEQVQRLATVIVDESDRAKLDPLFVLAIIATESAYDYEAVSKTGARGLMQVVPSTWREQVQRLGEKDLRFFEPEHNVRVGIGYLEYLAKSFRRPESVLLAYNQGPHMAMLILTKVMPPMDEGVIYVPHVMKNYQKLLAGHGLNPTKTRDYWRSPHLTLLKVTE